MKISQSLYQKHCNCEIAVDHNYRAQRHQTITAAQDPLMYELLRSVTWTPPALICVTHGKWLKWLTATEATEIERMLQEQS